MLRKFRIDINGKEYIVKMEELGAIANAPQVIQEAIVTTPQQVQQSSNVEVPTPTPTPIQATAVNTQGETKKAPMPGTILDVLVKVGDVVSEDQVLVILEAMKMENEIVAPKAGTITAVYVTKGSPVEAGAPIVTIS